MRLTERIHLVGSGSSGLYLTDAYDAHAFLVVSEADLSFAVLADADLTRARLLHATLYRARLVNADRGINQNGVVLYNPASMQVMRYRFHGAQISTPWNIDDVDPTGARFRHTTHDDVAFVGQVAELLSAAST